MGKLYWVYNQSIDKLTSAINEDQALQIEKTVDDIIIKDTQWKKYHNIYIIDELGARIKCKFDNIEYTKMTKEEKKKLENVYKYCKKIYNELRIKDSCERIQYQELYVDNYIIKKENELLKNENEELKKQINFMVSKLENITLRYELCADKIELALK
jgi:hypothetical protein